MRQSIESHSPRRLNNLYCFDIHYYDFEFYKRHKMNVFRFRSCLAHLVGALLLLGLIDFIKRRRVRISILFSTTDGLSKIPLSLAARFKKHLPLLFTLDRRFLLLHWQDLSLAFGNRELLEMVFQL